MKMKQGFCPAYNAQAMVSPVKTGQETTGMLVTAVELVDEPADYPESTEGVGIRDKEGPASSRVSPVVTGPVANVCKTVSEQ